MYFFLATLGLCFLRRKSLICTDPSSQTSDSLGILVPVIAWWDQHNPQEITGDNGAFKLRTRLPSESRESSEIRNSGFSKQEHQVMSNEYGTFQKQQVGEIWRRQRQNRGIVPKMRRLGLIVISSLRAQCAAKPRPPGWCMALCPTLFKHLKQDWLETTEMHWKNDQSTKQHLKGIRGKMREPWCWKCMHASRGGPVKGPT